MTLKPSLPDNRPLTELDSFIRKKMDRDRIPGVAGCIIKHGEVVWADAYGWANLEKRLPMTLDSVQNLCSISKTFVATAVMQLREVGLLGLEDDINEHLAFPVRHPRAPEQAITVKQLLIHTSAIADGLDYGKQYACGDPKMALSVWLREYFTPGGQFYDAGRNFHDWLPEDNRWMYCNLAYGLLAHLVEVVSGIEFKNYCQQQIFAPLGMNTTSWQVSDIDPGNHTIPYTLYEEGKPRGPDWGGVPLGLITPEGPTLSKSLPNGVHANCIYSHPNYPDGFLRSSVTELSHYAIALLTGGRSNNYRLLDDKSVDEMLTPHPVIYPKANVSDRFQGLTWSTSGRIGGEPAWGHSGNDPGYNNDIRLLMSKGIGAIVLTNSNGISPREFTHRFLEIAVDSSL